MDSFKNKLTVREVKTAMRSLPKGSDAYDVAYTAAMERIFAQGKESSEMAKRILSWILCARRPLRTLELLHALAVEVGDTEVDEENILDTKTLLTICAGLVTIDENSNNVRFIHYTTQEYLQRNRKTWLPFADVEIARNCTAYLTLERHRPTFDELCADPRSSKRPAYLSLDEARSELLSSNEGFDYPQVDRLALLDYAALHWGSHMNLLTEADFASEVGSELETEAMDFLCAFKYLSYASQALFMPEGRSLYGTIYGIKYVSEGGGLLGSDVIARHGLTLLGSHVIARHGLTLLFKQWDSREAQWDDRDTGGRTPLSWAAAEGQQVLSKLLLETGRVDANSRDILGRTPVSWASGNGQEGTVKLLLERKVDVNLKDEAGHTPLFQAAENGHEGVVKLLLSTNTVKVDSADEMGYTPLFVAVWENNKAIVKLLLDTNQVDINYWEGYEGTPLSVAVTEGYVAILKLMLDSGQVDVETKVREDDQQSLLSLASQWGGEAAVKLLLDTGKADVNSKDIEGKTPFSLAVERGYVEDKTPYSLAAARERCAVVKLLLDTGKVDVDSKDVYDKTPLHQAAINGQETLVKLLLDTGQVDVDSGDTDGRTPLSYATEYGFEGIVKLLLDAGAVPLPPERPALSPRVPAENDPAT
jgi:ankyrin repeat protein